MYLFRRHRVVGSRECGGTVELDRYYTLHNETSLLQKWFFEGGHRECGGDDDGVAGQGEGEEAGESE